MNILPDRKMMYQALVDKDSTFEGIFFVGVKTTGIFCRPSCTARKPKMENVDFFATSKEALSFGFRPCKICNPLTMVGETPAWLKTFLDEIVNHPETKLTDADLRKKNIEPARLRRWFKKNHGMTFQAYLRSIRINKAFGQIQHNEKIINSAFDSGYESLSGFTDAFKKKTGFSPSLSKGKNMIYLTRILSPLGPLFAAATDEGICLLEFTDRRMLETQISRLKKSLKSEIVTGEHIHFQKLNHQLHEYFSGTRKQFDIPLVIQGTDFQKKVWQVLEKIPYGTTQSYEEQAKAIHNPKAVRAVASANGDNKISIIIPCHRVIAKNGTLAGYGGGLWRKKFLLDLENQYK